MLDVTDSTEIAVLIRRWKGDKSHVPCDAVISLCANKIDVQPSKCIVSEKEGREFAARMGWDCIEVSVLAETNVENDL